MTKTETEDAQERVTWKTDDFFFFFLSSLGFRQS